MSAARQLGQTKRDFQMQFTESLDAIRPRRQVEMATDMPRVDQTVQVDLAAIPKKIPANHRKPLSLFLRHVESAVLMQLDRNLRSRAEKNVKVEWRSLTENAAVISEFPRKVFTDLSCVAAHWNSNGTLLATAFGRTDHDTFCFHKSGICVWRIFLGKPKVDPEHILNLDTCVSSIAFHPKKEHLLAAGGANGEIFLWDLKLSPDNLIGDSGLKMSGSHSEPITALHWVSVSPTSRTFMLLTAGLDGKLIVWGNNTTKDRPNFSTVVPSRHGMILQTTASLLKAGLPDSDISTSVMGITGMIPNKQGSNASCLIGTDTGAVGSCSFKDFKDVRSILIDSAMTLSYDPHDGPVSGISRSPFSDQCFATISSDGKLKLYRSANVSPVVETASLDDKLTCCDFSPFRPFVIAVGTSKGNLLYFDFRGHGQRTKPAKTVQIFPDSTEILSIQFNSRDSTIVAIGGVKGVQLWKVPEIFAVPADDESQAFSDFLREDSQFRE